MSTATPKKLHGITVEPVTKDEALVEITGGKPFEGPDPLKEVMKGNVVIMRDKGDGVLKRDTQVEGQVRDNSLARKR